MRRLGGWMAALPFGLASLGCAGDAFAPRPAWELPAPPPAEALVVQPGALHREELANGLRVLVLEDRRLPRVELGMTFRRGEAVLPPEQAGLASFTAALLERGAGERDALTLAEAIDARGANFGSGADWDTLAVSANGLSRDFDFLLEVLGDVILRPRFDAEEAARLRKERLASLERAKDDPGTLAQWSAAKALYEGHRYGVPLSGSAETVATLDETAAAAHARRVMLPNNAIFQVSGDVDAAQVLERVRAIFGDWQPGEVPAPGPPPPATTPEARKIVIVDRPELAQTRILVGHEGLARTDEDRVAASLMNSVVGGSGFSSRLMSTLRSEEGLTYGVYSGFALRRATGPFVVSMSTRVAATRKALDLLLAELERGRSEPPGESELVWARALAVGRFSMGLETSAAVAAGLVDLDVHGLPEDSLDTYRSRVRAITADEVATAALDHLHPDRSAIILVGPAEALVEAVEGLGPVEVVQP